MSLQTYKDTLIYAILQVLKAMQFNINLEQHKMSKDEAHAMHGNHHSKEGLYL